MSKVQAELTPVSVPLCAPESCPSVMEWRSYGNCCALWLTVVEEGDYQDRQIFHDLWIEADKRSRKLPPQDKHRRGTDL